MPEPRDAIYIRYSDERQEAGTSREVQMAACRQVTQGEPLIYEDLGVTGTTIDRPGLNRLLQDAERQRFDRLILYRWDRLGRTAYIHGVRADLISLGVRVISVTEGEDHTVAGVQLVIAEQESIKKSERVKDAKRRRFQEGRLHGGTTPFGYRKTDGHLEINPSEAELIRNAFNWYLDDNIGFQAIARRLNDLGSRPRRKNLWLGRTVGNIMRNPLYKGYPSYGSRAKRFLSPQNEPVTYRLERHAPELQIVSAKLFDAVNAKIDQRREERTAPHPKIRPFTRLLKCGCCGSGFIRLRGSRGKRHRLVCSTREKCGKDKCPNATRLYEDELISELTGQLCELLADRETIVREAVEQAHRRLDLSLHQAEDLGQRLLQLDQQINTLAARFGDPNLKHPQIVKALAGQIEEKEAERDRTRQQIAALRDQKNERPGDIEAQIQHLFDRMTERLDLVATDSQLNNLFKEWIGVMVVEADGSIRTQSVILPAEHPHGDGPASLRDSMRLHLQRDLQR
ncbi:MAG: recombinase family protein [Planctomycetota bacterium]